MNTFDSGDAWVTAPDGARFWGRYGAAGLLVHDPERGILLQHRSVWSHHGGTWGIPGGARHRGESATDGAVREAFEEAGIPSSKITVLFDETLDLGFWSYVTVVARVTQPFEPIQGDPESIEVRWVSIDLIDELPLHPAFAESWPGLRSRLLVQS